MKKGFGGRAAKPGQLRSSESSRNLGKRSIEEFFSDFKYQTKVNRLSKPDFPELFDGGFSCIGLSHYYGKIDGCEAMVHFSTKSILGAKSNSSLEKIKHRYLVVCTGFRG